MSRLGGENDPATYGERIAGIYDQLYPELNPRMIDVLATLAGQGRVLELGIGTGRVAPPLKAAGAHIEGIDASEAMLERLRAKPGGSEIPVTLGNFAGVPVEGPFRLIFVVFNTFFALLTQDEQIGCFQSVSERLTDDGCFVVEAFVPDPTRFVRNQAVTTSGLTDDGVELDVSRYDRHRQLITTQHVHLSEKGVNLYPVQQRFAWPSELDLMARLAGMRLRERWADWDRSSFHADSGKHVSVYEKQR